MPVFPQTIALSSPARMQPPSSGVAAVAGFGGISSRGHIDFNCLFNKTGRIPRMRPVFSWSGGGLCAGHPEMPRKRKWKNRRGLFMGGPRHEIRAQGFRCAAVAKKMESRYRKNPAGDTHSQKASRPAFSYPSFLRAAFQIQNASLDFIRLCDYHL